LKKKKGIKPAEKSLGCNLKKKLRFHGNTMTYKNNEQAKKWKKWRIISKKTFVKGILL
jgi:hypothetical protein